MSSALAAPVLSLTTPAHVPAAKPPLISRIARKIGSIQKSLMSKSQKHRDHKTRKSTHKQSPSSVHPENNSKGSTATPKDQPNHRSADHHAESPVAVKPRATPVLKYIRYSPNLEQVSENEDSVPALSLSPASSPTPYYTTASQRNSINSPISLTVHTTRTPARSKPRSTSSPPAFVRPQSTFALLTTSQPPNAKPRAPSLVPTPTYSFKSTSIPDYTDPSVSLEPWINRSQLSHNDLFNQSQSYSGLSAIEEFLRDNPTVSQDKLFGGPHEKAAYVAAMLASW